MGQVTRSMSAFADMAEGASEAGTSVFNLTTAVSQSITTAIYEVVSTSGSFKHAWWTGVDVRNVELRQSEVVLSVSSHMEFIEWCRTDRMQRLF